MKNTPTLELKQVSPYKNFTVNGVHTATWQEFRSLAVRYGETVGKRLNRIIKEDLEREKEIWKKG